MRRIVDDHQAPAAKRFATIAKTNMVAASSIPSDGQILLAGPPGDQTTIQLRDFIIRADFKGLKQYLQTLDEAGMEISPQLRAMADRAAG